MPFGLRCNLPAIIIAQALHRSARPTPGFVVAFTGSTAYSVSDLASVCHKRGREQVSMR
jgi:hypothetical protein